MFFLVGWTVAAWCIKPADYPSWYRCVAHSITGWYCAGCGSTRATHALVHGDILASLRQNPLVLVLGVPAAAWVLFRAFRPSYRARWKMPGWTGWAVLALVLSFWLIRNLPLAVFDVLRPLPASTSVE